MRLASIGALLALLFWTVIARADGAAPEGLASGPTAGAPASFDEVVAFVGRLSPSADRAALAVSGSDVGHWTLANRAGERFTAASESELRAGIAALAPEAGGRRERVAFYISADLFLRPDRVPPLGGSPVFVLVEGRPYPVLGYADVATPAPRVAVAPGLELVVSDWHDLREVLWQLARPVTRETIRLLALEPGGPVVLPRAPRADAATRQAMPDAADPGHLAGALSSLAGQLALVSGRVEDAELVYKPAAAGERRIPLAALTGAAASADVSLLVLASVSPRQAGTRNWLWQRTEVANLASAVEQQTLGTFLSALAGADARIAVDDRSPRRPDRIDLRLTRVGSEGRAGQWTDVVAGAWSDIVSETAGRVGLTGISLSLVRSDRQRELDRRWLPGIPSQLQLFAASLVAVALLALPTLGGWWRRVWPPEDAREYTHPAGYLLARAARAALFVAIFLPLAALPALVVRLVAWIAGALSSAGIARSAAPRVRAGPAPPSPD